MLFNNHSISGGLVFSPNYATKPLFSSVSYAEPVRLSLFTEEFPPLQIQVDGQPKGYVVEFIHSLVDEAAKELPMQIHQTKILPWKRAIKMTNNTENALFFSISRSPAREDKYHWIGQVSPYEVILYRHKHGPQIHAPSNINDLKGYKFGVQSGGVFEEYLKANGISDSDMVPITYGRDLMMLLEFGRVDFAFLVKQSYHYRTEQYDMDPHEFIPVLKIDVLSKELWLVAGQKTEPKVVEALTAAYQRLQQRNTLEKIIGRYQPDSAVMTRYREQKKAERLKGKDK
jgi:polar amino acid transport system substrate-binding protein